MGYEVQIIADSLAHHGARLTTFQLKYPRMIHSELLMHRAFSRSATSTRAVPVAKMIEWVMEDPAMPVFWGKDRSGMQASEGLSEAARSYCDECWLRGRDDAVMRAKLFVQAGAHKQIASRILEPWAHINVVVSATDFANFFALRCHRDAMPEMQKLAVMMARAYRESKPVVRPWASDGYHEAYHLPYVTAAERESHDVSTLRDLSTARCARVSYMTREGKTPDPAADLALARRLLAAGHWGPAEHPARTLHLPCDSSGNFRGWLQYRSTLIKNVHEKFDHGILDRDYADRDFIVRPPPPGSTPAT